MSGTGVGRGLSTRTVRKIEAPRPLKSPLNDAKNKTPLSSLVLPAKAIDSTEKLLLLMDAVVTGITSDDDQSLKPENRALLTANIISLCANLKIFGPQLESSMYHGQLDRAFLTFREGMVRTNLELEARVHLLDILELRECNWVPRRTSKSFTSKNLAQHLDDDLYRKHQPFSPVLQTAESTTHLLADEVIKNSGRYRDKASKTSKNYCKEEIIIRNSDSGKVMGIKGRRVHMIEQLSETIISFQKVQPTFKERLVQITGPSEEKITYATQLIEETIRNNSSPVRDVGGSDSSYSSDESYEKPGILDNSFKDNLANWNWRTDAYQYKHKVTFNDCVLTVTGNDYNYVTLAKAVLDDYFSRYGTGDVYDYSGSENLIIPSANDFIETDGVFVEQEAAIDQNSDLDVRYGAGDAEEDQILKELHQDLNCVSLEPNSSTINASIESFDENDGKGIEIDALRLIYTKEFLLERRKNPISQQEPQDWARVKEQYPALIKTGKVDDASLSTEELQDDVFTPEIKENQATEEM